MTRPIIAQFGPYAINIENGKKYAWCSCGQSKKQPFCDGSHKGTEFQPFIYEAEESKEVFFCGCKKTISQPFCDGSHQSLDK